VHLLVKGVMGSKVGWLEIEHHVQVVVRWPLWRLVTSLLSLHRKTLPRKGESSVCLALCDRVHCLLSFCHFFQVSRGLYGEGTVAISLQLDQDCKQPAKLYIAQRKS
jgi:hypothetical protein